MKKILIIIFLLPSIFSLAQVEVNVKALPAKPFGTPADFTSNVPSFSFTESFKLIVDINDVPALTGGGDIYIWGFIQGCCGAPTNGDFCDSNEANKMTNEGGGKWSIVIPSVKSFIGVGYKQARDAAIAAGRPGEQTRFGFLVKADNGCSGAQSNDNEIPFTGPVYVKEEFESFPLNASQGDVVTLIYNQDLEDNAAMKAQTEVYLYTVAELEGGGSIEPVSPAEVGNTASLKLVKNGTQYTISIIPNDFFEVPADKTIARINVLLRSKNDANINFGSVRQVRIVKIK